MSALCVVAKDVEGARKNFELAQRAYVQSDVRTFAPHVHAAAADVALLEGRADDALACIKLSLACSEAGAQQVSAAMVRIARAFSARGDHGEARRRLTDAIEIARAAGDLRSKLLAHLELARVDRRLQNATAAKSSLLQICRDALKLGAAPILEATLLELIDVERALGNEDEARRLSEVIEGVSPAGPVPTDVLKVAVEEHLLNVERQTLRL